MHSLGKLPISFHGALLQPMVPGSINGNPTQALLNLSAPSTTLMKGAVKAAGIEMRRHGAQEYVGGSAYTYEAEIKELRVGPVVGAGRFIVEDSASLDYGISVGASFLLQRDAEIWFANKTIEFYKTDGCRDASLAYWGDAVALSYTNEERQFNRPEFKVKINGKLVRAFISSSLTKTYLDQTTAKSLGITPTSAGVIRDEANRGLGDRAESWIVPIDSVEIAEEKITGTKLQMADLYPMDGVIFGLDFLRSHRILISPSQHRIYISYVGGEPFSELQADGTPWFSVEAEQGNPYAQYQMGQYYSNGEHVPRNDALALAWFAKAAVKERKYTNAA